MHGSVSMHGCMGRLRALGGARRSRGGSMGTLRACRGGSARMQPAPSCMRMPPSAAAACAGHSNAKAQLQPTSSVVLMTWPSLPSTSRPSTPCGVGSGRVWACTWVCTRMQHAACGMQRALQRAAASPPSLAPWPPLRTLCFCSRSIVSVTLLEACEGCQARRAELREPGLRPPSRRSGGWCTPYGCAGLLSQPRAPAAHHGALLWRDLGNFDRARHCEVVVSG